MEYYVSESVGSLRETGLSSAWQYRNLFDARVIALVKLIETDGLTTSASYLYVRGVKLSRTRNINLLSPGPIFGLDRADPRFADVYQLEDSAGSSYQGASFALNRRMSNELQFSANYTR